MTSQEDPAPGPRQIDDAVTLRALAHPVRLALIEHLSIRGPLTATEAAQLVGESPSACSFHLRQLAKYGFVEEAGDGTGRRRPWRMTRIGMAVDPDAPDPAARRAGAEVVALLRSRQLERYRRWTRERADWPEAWRRAAIDDEYAFWVTPEELDALHEELGARLFALGKARLSDPASRPEGALPVELLLLAHPMEEQP
jgi:DNA-binding transcriptional ArsR family regulator